jgi:hypothetical protein
VLARAFSLVKALIRRSIRTRSTPPAPARPDDPFRHDPWTLLQPILGYPVVTWTIDFLYALWLFVMYFAILLQITSTPRPAGCARSSDRERAWPGPCSAASARSCSAPPAPATTRWWSACPILRAQVAVPA